LRLKNGAAIAPFFAFRVFGIRSLNLNYKSRRIRLLNIVTFGLAGKIARKAELYADAMLCESCHFYSIWNRIPNESLDALYIDYRAADYDSDREQYEPGYIKNISDKIGKQEEAKSRLAHQAEYFKVIESAGVFKASDVRCALDWGGRWQISSSV